MSTPGAATEAAASIKPATGKLGVMVPGMGAVATTLIAGVEAVRRGLAKPIGSLTQMGTIRLGKRTDARSPLIKDFTPIANLNDIVFTGWDISVATSTTLPKLPRSSTGINSNRSVPISNPSSPCPLSSTSTTSSASLPKK